MTAMPSPRPAKAEAVGARAADADGVRRDAGRSATRRRISADMRRELRGLRDRRRRRRFPTSQAALGGEVAARASRRSALSAPFQAGRYRETARRATRRPRLPRIASATACSSASPSECPFEAARVRDLDAAEPEARPSANGCASKPMPTRDPALGLPIPHPVPASPFRMASGDLEVFRRRDLESQARDRHRRAPECRGSSQSAASSVASRPDSRRAREDCRSKRLRRAGQPEASSDRGSR